MSYRAFIFGKAPAHGDFVSRGLTSEAEAVWDTWASRELAEAEARLGAEFAAAHDVAPPCRFVAGPGALGADWRAGSVVASVDSAGRRYILAAGLNGMAADVAGAHGLAVAARCEGVLYDALTERMTADATLQALEQSLDDPADRRAAQALGAEATSPGVWWAPADDAVSERCAEPPPGFISNLLSRAALNLAAPS
jgi:type VI secretion system ImpM family protein